MSSEKKQLECTISPELLEAWQTLKRKKDSFMIANIYGWSRPTIDNALLYGHVKTPQVTDHINEFFLQRQEKEKNDAKTLLKDEKV